MHLVDASYQKQKSASILGAVKEVNRIRFLIRLSRDVGVVTADSCGFAATPLEEVGRMAGGWLASANRKDAAGIWTILKPAEHGRAFV